MSAPNSAHTPRTLTIAGSFSDGGAGIQADLKTFTALSTFGVSVVTALAAGKTCGVGAIFTVPDDFVTSQFDSVTSGADINAVKIDIHFSPSLIECVVALITKMKVPGVVLDPVLVTSQLSSANLTILRDRLFPIATLITPSLNEAAILLEREILSLDDMKRAAQDLHRLGPKYVLIRGDHLVHCASPQSQTNSDENPTVVDVLFDGLNFTLFESSLMSTRNTPDTRCTLSAAITAFLAHTIDMSRAVEYAIAYTYSAVQKQEVFVADKQQQSQSKSDDKVVVVSSQCWTQESRVLPHQRSFVQLLKEACSKEWFDYTHHPFVQGLADGTLSEVSFKHYLTQDYIFLTHFARCSALAAYKSSTMADIAQSAEIVCGVARETKLHVSYCAEWGIDAVTLESTEEARANLAYTRFTLDCGMTGDLLDLHVALAACLFGYGDIALRLSNDPRTKRDSPYWKWISNYADEHYQKACREGEVLLERLANEFGVWHSTTRMKKLTNTFRTATKLEIGFWNMGLNVEW